MKQLSLEQFTQRMAPEALCDGSICGAISLEAIQFLLEQGRLWDVRAGETIYRYGEAGGSFFIVCQGAVDFVKEHDGHRFHTRTAHFGQEVGFVAMIALHDHVGTAIARDDSLLLEIDSALFSELHRTHPVDFGLLTLNLARDMARVVRKLSDLLVDNAIRH